MPSRILLDDPFPENLPKVASCRACNQGFSLDEEYVACLLDCTLAGTVDGVLQRPKVRRILSKKPALAARLRTALVRRGDDTTFTVEHERVKNVVLKLARGHALFELSEVFRDDPDSVGIVPLSTLSLGERERFEEPPSGIRAWPEVGSRAMQRAVIVTMGHESGVIYPEWISVQPGRYRYLAFESTVRIVLSEYLACEVVLA